jgi:hypothetical protein
MKKRGKKKSGKKKPSRRGASGRTVQAKRARKTAARKKSATKAKAVVRKKKTQKKKTQKKKTRKKKPAATWKKTRAEGYVVETLVGLPKESRGPTGLQSGDLQGLSDAEVADSESVDELLEEGNAFEAGIVAGVEGSRDEEGREVRTREVPEDDVPDEYLDED